MWCQTTLRHVESFSGQYFCRFCTAQRAETQATEVKSGDFTPRNKELYQVHVNSAQAAGGSCFGVKKERLAHFSVTSGYPPDVVHDLFEGIVPVELAWCFGVLISKKLFTLDDLNKRIKNFPYKWGDKKKSPSFGATKFCISQNNRWQCALKLVSVKVIAIND